MCVKYTDDTYIILLVICWYLDKVILIKLCVCKQIQSFAKVFDSSIQFIKSIKIWSKHKAKNKCDNSAYWEVKTEIIKFHEYSYSFLGQFSSGACYYTEFRWMCMIWKDTRPSIKHIYIYLSEHISFYCWIDQSTLTDPDAVHSTSVLVSTSVCSELWPLPGSNVIRSSHVLITPI